MALKNFIFGIIVIAGLMTGIVLFINEANVFYSVTPTSENLDFYSKINTTQRSTSSFVAGWEKNTTNPSFIGGIFQFGSGLVTSILAMKDSGQAVIGLIGYSQERVTGLLP